MICGSFAHSGSDNNQTDWNDSHENSSGISFHPVSQGCFTGGYYLQKRLPLNGDDFYYYDQGEDLLVLLSGYIYNKSELADHYGFDHRDPEPRVAARLFRDQGPEFVRRLNGDFTIFIGQPAGRRAYLFRDQVGIRPVAYSADSTRIVFSSDITDLCHLLAANVPPERDFLLGFFKYVDYTRTPSEQVKKLLPGHYLEYSSDGSRLTRYWEPEKIKTNHRLSYDIMLSDLKLLVEDAVAIRCDNRFNAGAHVSSGLDSCTVAALARRNYSPQNSFYGYSWSPAGFTPPDPAYDERDMVRSHCSKTGIEPVFSDLTPREFLDRVSEFYHNKGYFIEENTLEQARDKGTNLLFSGWGGDEFISTGDRGIETDLLRRLNIRTWVSRNPFRPIRRFIKYLMQYTVLPAVGVLQPDVARAFAKDAYYIRKSFRKSHRTALRNYYFHTSRRQLHLRYLKFYHLQERCESWMISGYRRGIEYRYPLLDRRIIEYMIKVPSLLLCRTDYFRPLLRIIGEGLLPDDVRLNYSKRDPVYMEWWHELFRLSGLELMNEVEQWSGNPDLDFIDFEKLNDDIARYRSDPGAVDGRVLFKALVYMKGVHRFTVEYHA